jgi:hypothetical protein
LNIILSASPQSNGVSSLFGAPEPRGPESQRCFGGIVDATCVIELREAA